MTRHEATCHTVAILLLWMLPTGAEAQGGGPPAGNELAIAAEQGLGFGSLIPGEMRTVTPLDTELRAELRIQGAGSAFLAIILPEALEHTHTEATIPLSFAAADAWADPDRQAGFAFDPHDGIEIMHGRPVAETVIFLGGTAAPTRHQAAGSYRASITTILMEIDT